MISLILFNCIVYLSQNEHFTFNFYLQKVKKIQRHIFLKLYFTNEIAKCMKT